LTVPAADLAVDFAALAVLAAPDFAVLRVRVAPDLARVLVLAADLRALVAVDLAPLAAVADVLRALVLREPELLRAPPLCDEEDEVERADERLAGGIVEAPAPYRLGAIDRESTQCAEKLRAAGATFQPTSNSSNAFCAWRRFSAWSQMRWRSP
jgi:hypothetical protein